MSGRTSKLQNTFAVQFADYSNIVVTRSRISDIPGTLAGSMGISWFACVVIVLNVADDALPDVIRLPTRTVALSGQSAPGVAGASFSHFSSPALNATGQTAWVG